MEKIRLNKYLASAGICSRRGADRLIEEGRVCVDGEVATLGMEVTKEQCIMVDHKVVEGKEPFVLLLVNKPRGIVCTEEPKEKNNIIAYLNYPQRITYIGRLDKDSEGLLLMTNEGDLINKMMRAGNYHEKEYHVQVDHEVTDDFIEQMKRGVPILDTITRPCKVKKTGKDTFTIILTQGLNRQIRRMCQALSYEVVHLKRVRVMNFTLGNLKEGEYRKATEEEIKTLYELVANSSKETVKDERTKKEQRRIRQKKQILNSRKGREDRYHGTKKKNGRAGRTFK